MADTLIERPMRNPTLDVFLTAIQFKPKAVETASAPQSTDCNPTMKIAITAARRCLTGGKDGSL